MAERGLRDAELLRGAAEMELVRDGREIANLAQLHGAYRIAAGWSTVLRASSTARSTNSRTIASSRVHAIAAVVVTSSIGTATTPGRGSARDAAGRKPMPSRAATRPASTSRLVAVAA